MGASAGEVHGDGSSGAAERAVLRQDGVVDDTIEKAGRSLDEVLGIVTGFSESIRSALGKAEHPPANASVEFGLEITGKGTIYVVEFAASTTESPFLIPFTGRVARLSGDGSPPTLAPQRLGNLGLRYARFRDREIISA